MAEKNRTNWSDKARRITGGITLIVIILIILLCVLLGKKTNKSAKPEATIQPVSAVTEVKEQEKKEEPVTVVKDSPVVEEKVDTKIEEPKVPVVEEPIIDIEVTDEPLYSSGEVSFEVCGITVQNSWSDGTFVSTSNAKERFLKDDVMAFVRYEADKYLSYMDKETVFKIIVSTGTIKIEYPTSIDPEILMPYYKNDIEEYASSIAPKEETVEEPIVKEVVEEKVVEVVPETYDFTVFGYKVLNSWVPGIFTSLSETKGLLYESDIKGFVEYEIGKYGDFLLDNVAIEYVADGFVLRYPEVVDPSAYISQYKSDIEEYVLSLFAPVEEVEEPVSEAVSSVISGYDEFKIMGFVVENTWYDGTYLAETAINGILTEADIRGFVLYEVAKYGAFLTENAAVEYTPDGFMLSIPRELDPSPYIPVFKSNIEEYISKLFAPVEEEVAKEEVKVEEPVVPETADFTVFGYKVLNSWVSGTFTSVSETKGLLSETDVKGFAEYEIGKYGDFLLDNVAIEYVADGFVLRYPEVVDPSAYISQYKSDIEEYVLSLFAPVEEVVEEPVVEEPVVEEPVIEETVVEVVPETYDFTVFGYKVLNSWVPGIFTSLSETKGLLYESDIKGFVEYEIGKYGDFLLDNVAIKYVADGFVLRYPEAVDPSAYISQYKSDIEEYVLSLFAPVEEVVEEPVVEEPVVEEPVVEEPVIEETVVEVVLETYDFTVFGYKVLNSWVPGIFTSLSETKGLLYESDIKGFVEYEIGKYGDFLLENVAIKYVAAGFVLRYPEAVDPSAYISQYKSDIEEYVLSLFAPVEEVVEEPVVEEPVVEEPVVEEPVVEEPVVEEPVVEEPVVEEPVIEETVVEVVPETYDFTVFGYKVLNSWVSGIFTSLSETKGLLYESDIKGFVEYEIGKYGDFLLDNVAIKYVADGFVLRYPEVVDPSAYISQYKSDIEEYVLSLFAPVEEVEEPVSEAVSSVISGYDEFKIMGFVVENTWYDGTYLAETAINGILTEADIRGFVLYEVAKYGAFLTENAAVEYTPDGFMLSIPRELDPSPYIPVFKSDIEEYISKLFAPVEEVVVEEPVVEETVEAPVVPKPVFNIGVSVVIDGVKVVLTEDNTSPVAEKVTSFDVSLSLGADFGFKTGRGYNPTIFPTFNITGEFRNMFSLGPIGVGTRFDAAFIFRPLDGTFVGHEFKFFLNGNNWAVDGTLDTKLMFSLDWGQTRAYLGIGVGYSLASNVSGITSHIGPQVFGFNSAVVATGVLGLQWKLGDALFMSLEGQGRYFVQTKEYNFGGAVRIGWSF